MPSTASELVRFDRIAYESAETDALNHKGDYGLLRDEYLGAKAVLVSCFQPSEGLIFFP